MSPLAYWIAAVLIVAAYIAVRLWMIRDHRKEPAEMDADYDPLAHIREAERMIATAKYGHLRDGHEV